LRRRTPSLHLTADKVEEARDAAADPLDVEEDGEGPTEGRLLPTVSWWIQCINELFGFAQGALAQRGMTRRATNDPAEADEPKPDEALRDASRGAGKRCVERSTPTTSGGCAPGHCCDWVVVQVGLPLWEEKLCGIYLALLPIVCQTEVMICHSKSPKGGAVCCGYEIAYMLIYHLEMSAQDLPGASKLKSERRGRVSKDELYPGNAAIKRLLKWS
jgi:hypothetical protein